MTAEFPPYAALPSLTLHESTKRDQLDVSTIAGDWFASLSKKISNGQLGDLTDLFLEENSWWRDFLSLSWNITSKEGIASIKNYIGGCTTGFSQLTAIGPSALQPMLVELGPMIFIQSGFNFKTNYGTGKGVLRLANVGPESWKAWTVFTQLDRLVGQDEIDKQKMTLSGSQSIDTETLGVGDMKTAIDELQVMVIGAGQSGLAIAAELQTLDIKTLVVDKSPSAGDSWRAKYESVKSHTPIFSDHFPFMKYPSNWPRWLDREHIIKWMEHYEQLMGIHVLRGTTVQKVQYDESTQRYTVEIENGKGKQTLNPKQIVQATGLFSSVAKVPEIPGMDSFKGLSYHTSKHQSAANISDLSNKKVVIIGCGTSAHDVAQDLVNRGAKSVSMVQRYPIYSMSLDSVEKFQFNLWNTPGVSLDEADLLGNSFSTKVTRTMGIGMSQMMDANDKEMLDKLEKAGLALRRGEANSLLDHALIKGGHFYVDQGANQMIIDGKIKILRCEQGVTEIRPEGVVLGNGTTAEADVIILATGYERNALDVERIMGKQVLDKIGNFGFLDDEQERVGWWRPTGQPGFWFMTGSFLWCRQFSHIVALQISAIERGLNAQHYKA